MRGQEYDQLRFRIIINLALKKPAQDGYVTKDGNLALTDRFRLT